LWIVAACKKQFLHIKCKEWKNSKCLERCIRQFVLIVVRNAKSRSSLTQADLFTAENAGLKEEAKEEDIRLS
jgi:hypothetical protein